MRKSSLGQRKTSRTLGSLGSESMRKTGIPMRVGSSSQDRNIMPVQSTSKMRSKSALTLNNEMTPRTPNIFYNHNLPTETARPSRNATISTGSSRISSFGGSKVKKDARPLQDKEWQIMTERMIVAFFASDPHGAELIKNTNIKNMTLNLFVDMVDFLFKKLDSSCSINKVNYKLELPFLLKKMQYRGKVDKSWLVTVNAPHVWPYVLGVLHFLIGCIESWMTTEPLQMMYPDEFILEQDDERDMKVFIPYCVRSYTLFQTAPPDYEAQQEFLDEEFIHGQIPMDLFENLEGLENQVKELQEEVTNLKCKTSQDDLQFVQQTLSLIETDLKNGKEFEYQKEGYIKNIIEAMQGVDEDLALNERVVEMRKKEKEKYTNKVKDQVICLQEVEILRKRRISLQRTVESENKYIAEYSNIIFTEDTEIMHIKKKCEGIILQHNLSIANCISLEPDLEKLKVGGNISELNIDEMQLHRIMEDLKEKYRKITASSQKDIHELSQEVQMKNSEMEREEDALKEKELTKINLQQQRMDLCNAINLKKKTLENELLKINECGKNLSEINISDLKSELMLKKEKYENMKKQLEHIEKNHCTLLKGLIDFRQQFVLDLMKNKRLLEEME